MKKLIPAYIIAFVSGFMLFINEPLNLYATNTNDFWFDINIIIKPLMLYFAVYFISVSVIYTIIFIVNNLISKKLYVYKTIVIISLILFIALYIQGNFLIGELPFLNGDKIEWQYYKTEDIISVAIWLVIALIITIVTIKFKYEKTIKVYTFVVLAIFVMILASLTSLIIKPGVLTEKQCIVASTSKNINNISEDKNFIIFLIDAADSIEFSKNVEEGGYKDLFNDFTYYPDTMGAYSFTRESVPFILSGIWNENEYEYNEYLNNAMDNSELIKELKENDYQINIYKEDFPWNTEKSKDIANFVRMGKKINYIEYLKQIGKYDLFKYLPYPLKRFSKIETMDYSICKVQEKQEYHSESNGAFYNTIRNNSLNKITQKYFSYVHIEGAHAPFDYNEDVIRIENGTYDQKILSSLKILETYINRLKESDAYDNSVIIVMADHGYNYDNYIGRQNPILYIKGIDEKHEEMINSDIPVSFVDLNNAYKQLINGASSSELFKDIDKNRKRRFLLYEFRNEEKMIEQEQTGKAWNVETMVSTGREYNR